MRLRYLRISAWEYQEELGSDFSYVFDYNAEFICNYLSKAIRTFHVETGSYKMICVTLHPQHNGCNKKIISDVLEVFVKFTKDNIAEFRQLTNPTKRYERYLSLLEQGYLMAISEGHTEIPLEILIKIHQQFRDGEYRNEWLWKKKLIRHEDMYLFFYCRFSSFNFRLHLLVTDNKKENIKAEGNIMETLPDEIHYDKEFKKIVLTDKAILILDFLGHLFCSIDMAALRQGTVRVTYHSCSYIKSLPETARIMKQITW